VALNLGVGGWGLYLWRRDAAPPRAFWYAIGAAWGAVYLQGIFGLAVYRKTVAFKHTFYGFLFVIVTMMVFPVRTEKARTRLLIFASAAVFIGIVAVRAIVSGRAA
jgi:hypothetical protein